MDCMKLKVINENDKVRRALCPQQTCPNKVHLCPPQNDMRSSIYHPDHRTENQFCCTQECNYIPTEEALKETHCYNQQNRPLYNQPKYEEQDRIKVITDGRCYPHRNINQLHCNLRAPSSCADTNARQLYICKDCGCGYQQKNDCYQPCVPAAKGNSCNTGDYFEVDPNQYCGQDYQVSQVQNGKCDDETENKNSAPAAPCNTRNHFEGCQCGLCNRRQDTQICNGGTNFGQCPKSTKSTFGCGPQTGTNNCDRDDSECPTESGPSCCTQPNVIASVPDYANPEQSNYTPCHHVFRLSEETKQQPTAHCVIDMSNDTIRNGNCAAIGRLPYSQSVQMPQQSPEILTSGCWSNGFGNGSHVNQCVPQSQQKKKGCWCNSFAHAVPQDCEQLSHGANCPCHECTRFTRQGTRRPSYYAHVQAKNRCRNQKSCPVPKAPVGYPVMYDVGWSGTSRPQTASQDPQHGRNFDVCTNGNTQFSCKSSCLCHVMIPKEWEPQEYGNCGKKATRPTCGRQVKLPSCNSRREGKGSARCEPAKTGCMTPPCLVRSLEKINGAQATAGFNGRCKPANPTRGGFKC